MWQGSVCVCVCAKKVLKRRNCKLKQWAFAEYINLLVTSQVQLQLHEGSLQCTGVHWWKDQYRLSVCLQPIFIRKYRMCDFFRSQILFQWTYISNVNYKVYFNNMYRYYIMISVLLQSLQDYFSINYWQFTFESQKFVNI